MKKRIIWLVVSVLMVLSLVLASCAPKVTEEEEVVTEEKKVVTEEKKVVTVEKKVAKEEALLPYQKVTPEYGGTLNLVQETDPGVFDQADFNRCAPFVFHSTNDNLLNYDRMRGPGGTDEWPGGGYPNVPMQEFITGTGSLAESWEMDWPNRFTLHIRKGVRWQDKPPANGREMTAEDVLFNLRRLYGDPGTYAYRTMGGLRDMKDVAGSIYLDPADPRAVVVETNPDLAYLAWEQATMLTHIVPKEQTTKVTRWQDLVGTGPFILTDYVSGSSYTFQRNPNYWAKDQLYPQNQLPYVDVLKIFIMPDWASQLAAVQSGKIDWITGVPRDNAEILWRFNPEMVYIKFEGSSFGMSMRHDVKPFDDVRVRRAMMMAVDQPAILRDFFKGDGVLFYYPAHPAHGKLYTPLEEMPESIQILYQYRPDEAGRLLDEAGYPGPNRFTTSVSVWQEEKIDMMSIVAAYWKKVGVTLNIDVREYGVYQRMMRARSFPHGSTETQTTIEPYKFCVTGWGASRSVAMIDKDYVEEARKAMSNALWDFEEQARIIKELTLKYQEDALIQVLPWPNEYRFWQPWLKGYYGERNGSYLKSTMFAQYTWIDQELKQAMTGRR